MHNITLHSTYGMSLLRYMKFVKIMTFNFKLLNFIKRRVMQPKDFIKGIRKEQNLISGLHVLVSVPDLTLVLK